VSRGVHLDSIRSLMVAGRLKGSKHERHSRFQGTFSAAEFDRIAAPLPGLQEPFLTLTGHILVEGKSLARTAQSAGQARSNLWFWCQRLESVRIPSGWKRVTLIVPTEIARRFKREAATVPAATDHASRPKRNRRPGPPPSAANLKSLAAKFDFAPKHIYVLSRIEHY
jgi:hypothetical protein